MKAEYLMLAQVYDPNKHTCAGKYVSEKLDGTRAYWDGGVSRGAPLVTVPWANVRDKTGAVKKNLPSLATGLWSRYGNPIMAPDWFLNQMPCCPLDGELWAGRGEFQKCRSVVSRDEPDERWQDITYVAFGSPSPANMYSNRTIKGSNIQLEMSAGNTYGFIQQRIEAGVIEDYQGMMSEDTFERELAFLNDAIGCQENISVHYQRRLSNDENEARDELNRFLYSVLDNGGEGAMLRNAHSVWKPHRTYDLLKVKPFQDDDAVVVGFTSGRETDKGSKNRGKIGALITEYKGKRLELSGMTDKEREFANREMYEYAYANPGKDMPSHFQGAEIQVGDTVEFRYVGHETDAGLPKEARYTRVKCTTKA